MLSEAMNERLSRVGPGNPHGRADAGLLAPHRGGAGADSQ